MSNIYKLLIIDKNDNKLLISTTLRSRILLEVQRNLPLGDIVDIRAK